ncbi:hypothetical protein OIU92_32315 [Escherichia coli]|nr:hypothetical protein [Escherichia coli]
MSSGTFTLPARFCREILPDDVRSITILLEKATMTGGMGVTDTGQNPVQCNTDAFALLSMFIAGSGESKFSLLPAFL